MSAACTAAPPWAALGKALRRVQSAVQRRRAEAQARRELEALDHHALRDIGLDRTEFGSAMAEYNGMAEPSRRRIASWG